MPEHIRLRERLRVESFHRLGKDVILGEIAIDQDKCNGCGLCTHCCAASAIVLKNKKASINDELPACMSCGDCVSICPQQAITLKEFIQFKCYFRYLDRGKPEPPRKF
jgi:MinD superfamily P-loop ATPase